MPDIIVVALDKLLFGSLSAEERSLSDDAAITYMAISGKLI